MYNRNKVKIIRLLPGAAIIRNKKVTNENSF